MRPNKNKKNNKYQSPKQDQNIGQNVYIYINKLTEKSVLVDKNNRTL